MVKIGEGGSFAMDSFELPCGRCIGCKLDRTRSWAVRITHEAQLYDSNRFATLTYSDEGLPASRSLEYRDFQLFMKRLRREFRGVSSGPEGNFPLRFFCAGEYGTRRLRPHYHAILFNLKLPDEARLMNGSMRSEILEQLWRKGTVQLDDVTPRSAAYVAGYSVKKVYGPRADAYYEDVVHLETGEVTRRRPEFVAMSLKPGIGAGWYEKYGKDLFPHDFAVQEGRRYKVPRYYWDKFKESADAGVVEELEFRRLQRAQERRSDSTPERRAVREVHAKAKQEFYSQREDL